MNRSKTNRKYPTVFCFLLLPGFTMHAYSSAIEVLRLANKQVQHERFEYSTCTLGGEAVEASNGTKVLPDHSAENVAKHATLVVIAGEGAREAPFSETIALLRKKKIEGCKIWAVSSGVVVLAKAGFLDGREVAAHWEDIPYLSECYPRVRVSNNLFHANAEMSTCSGGQAATDLMLKVVSEHCELSVPSRVVSVLVMENMRDGRVEQRSISEVKYQTRDPFVHQALQLMRANLYDPIRIGEMADLISIGQQSLERRFQSEFQNSPLKIYRAIRFDAARNEVLLGRRKVVEIAADYGYTAAAFAKIYLDFYGSSPAADRAATS